MTLLEKILSAIKPSVLLIQTLAPTAARDVKTSALMQIVGAFAGLGATLPLPGKYTSIVSALAALTVQELQESGEIVKDAAPVK